MSVELVQEKCPSIRGPIRAVVEIRRKRCDQIKSARQHRQRLHGLDAMADSAGAEDLSKRVEETLALPLDFSTVVRVGSAAIIRKIGADRVMAIEARDQQKVARTAADIEDAPPRAFVKAQFARKLELVLEPDNRI